MSKTNSFAVSTWSLHRKLGFSHDNGPGSGEPFVRKESWGAGSITLAQLPAELAARGFKRCEICHFHLASLDRAYLQEVSEAFRSAGVTIQTLLIDDGDISSAESRDRDLGWVARFIDAAAVLGAENARVIAGKKQPSAGALALSVDGLKTLARLGRDKGVRVVTENWFDLLSSPREVHHVLDAVGPDLGFLADTGNWDGPSKYTNLQSIFARAELCHAKTGFGPGQTINAADYTACIKAAQAANYSGPYTLIFDNDGDEWEGLAAERAFITALNEQ
jgi:sugar phosphate isomerase/epimerase